MTRLDRVSRNCLRGEPPPDDLRRLWEANATQAWNDFVPFVLAEKLDSDFFEGYRESDGISAQVANAYRRMFEHIAFVGNVRTANL